jgi:hypothetical protein
MRPDSAPERSEHFVRTFLVLLRKAASLASRNLLANWLLYGAAYQIARKARAMIAKRGRERQVEELPDRVANPPDPWRDLGPVLDQ